MHYLKHSFKKKSQEVINTFILFTYLFRCVCCFMCHIYIFLVNDWQLMASVHHSLFRHVFYVRSFLSFWSHGIYWEVPEKSYDWPPWLVQCSSFLHVLDIPFVFRFSMFGHAKTGEASFVVEPLSLSRVQIAQFLQFTVTVPSSFPSPPFHSLSGTWQQECHTLY